MKCLIIRVFEELNDNSGKYDNVLKMNYIENVKRIDTNKYDEIEIYNDSDKCFKFDNENVIKIELL